jgi:hypothetical protein
MVKPRVIETSEGIQGEFDVQAYDQMARKLRRRGWMVTNDIIRSGITSGLALELSPGLVILALNG